MGSEKQLPSSSEGPVLTGSVLFSGEELASRAGWPIRGKALQLASNVTSTE